MGALRPCTETGYESWYELDELTDSIIESIDWFIEWHVGLSRGVPMTTARLRTLIAETNDGYGGILDGKADHVSTWNDIVHCTPRMSMDNWVLRFREIAQSLVFESAVVQYGEYNAMEIAMACMTPDLYWYKSQYWDEMDGIDAPVRYFDDPPRKKSKGKHVRHHRRPGIG